MKKSIRFYYFTSIATVLVTSVIVMGLIQTYLAIEYFRQERQQLLGQVAYGVQVGFAGGEITPVLDALPNLNFTASLAGADVAIAGTDGRIYFCTDGVAQLGGQMVSDQVLREVIKTSGYWELGTLSGVLPSNYYVVAAPLYNHLSELSGFVFVMSDAMNLTIYMADVTSSFVLSASLVLLISSLLAVVLASRTVIPIRRVSEAARKFGEGDYSARVPVVGDDELTQLSITFNEMASSFEATDTSRRSFMGNIAHELRTPMTTIKGFIDGILDGTIPEDQRDKYLSIVSGEVGRLARLTQNMLDISRLEAGEHIPETTVFDLWGPVTTVFLSAEQRIDDKKITVTGIEPTKPIQVLADEDFVHQVLFNLVDNAIKFTGEGGEIRVEVRPGKTAATISITNTGAGIPKDSLPYIFDRFYIADKSRGTNTSGSGLGLHICKVLVGLMGGRIWAESEEDEYARFEFTLPNAPQKKGNARRSEDNDGE